MPLAVVRHAVIDEALARLRDRTTEPEEFRRVAKRVALILASEATRGLSTREGEVETPLETTRVMRLATRVVAVPILRAGVGMLEPFLEVVPEAEVGYFGLQRDEHTAVARRYYEKIPKDLATAEVFLLDPMLATGGSAVMAIEGLRGMGAKAVHLLSIVAAPEGVAHVEAACPGTMIWAAALDRELNERKFILPGLGDFGDRLYGT
ncbi:MAG TPA: uracil phosphoribosyltransferase [Vicinamibacteria bacterium]|nr:uracil phosphoribosyltransferase [Vicinamibacteria bacterium]